jgi:hypothetical protein
MSQHSHTSIFTTASGVLGGVTKAVTAKPILTEITLPGLSNVVICDGAKGQEIADAVFTSKKNLDLIRTKLMKKFNVTTANELIRLSIINGFYKPRSNEEIELEKENILLVKRKRLDDDFLNCSFL